MKWTTLSVDDREEVVCRTALQYSKLRGEVEVRNPLALLLSIARCQRRQLLRENSRRRHAEERARQFAEQTATIRRGAEDTFEEVREQLSRLPKAERDVVTLRFIHGLKLREAADQLHVSAAVAANLTFRGKRHLRRHFGQPSVRKERG